MRERSIPGATHIKEIIEVKYGPSCPLTVLKEVHLLVDIWIPLGWLMMLVFHGKEGPPKANYTIKGGN